MLWWKPGHCMRFYGMSIAPLLHSLMTTLQPGVSFDHMLRTQSHENATWTLGCRRTHSHAKARYNKDSPIHNHELQV